MNNVVINKELMRKVRSFRNNNPLNIKRNARNRWFGAKSNQTDKVFEEFEGLEYGVRAALIILKKYIDIYKLDTIYAIISKWAPEGENGKTATKNYINRVAQSMHKNPHTEHLQFSDQQTIAQLIAAMTLVESGTNYYPVADYQEFIISVYNKYFDYE